MGLLEAAAAQTWPPQETRRRGGIVCRLARENTWGYRRIRGELAKQGIQISKSCIGRVEKWRGGVGMAYLLAGAFAGCGLEVPRLHRWGFPCCVRSPCAHVPSPLPRRGRWGESLTFPSDGSLP